MYPSPSLQAYTQQQHQSILIASIDEDGEGQNGYSDLASSSKARNDTFFLSTKFSKWQEAETFCIVNGGSLVEIDLSDTHARYIKIVS